LFFIFLLGLGSGMITIRDNYNTVKQIFFHNCNAAKQIFYLNPCLPWIYFLLRSTTHRSWCSTHAPPYPLTCQWTPHFPNNQKRWSKIRTFF
jgi:hypothetical protein